MVLRGERRCYDNGWVQGEQKGLSWTTIVDGSREGLTGRGRNVKVVIADR